MLKSFNLFGIRYVRDDDATKRIEVAKKAFRKELDRKTLEILKLKAEVAKYKSFEIAQRPFIDLSVGDPVPSDSEARKLYVATVAEFFKTYFNPKLYAMISNVREQLEKMDSTVDAQGNPMTSFKSADFDKILKGTINALWLMYDWGVQMTNEQIAYNRVLSEGERETLTELVQP